jgi:hypothetical protein
MEKATFCGIETISAMLLDVGMIGGGNEWLKVGSTVGTEESTCKGDADDRRMGDLSNRLIKSLSSFTVHALYDVRIDWMRSAVKWCALVTCFRAC